MTTLTISGADGAGRKSMPQYMLLLHQDPSGFARLSPEQMQAAVEKYMAWGQKLRQAGYLTASNKLTDEPGRVVRSNDGQLRVTDGPYSETKEVLGGYFTIEAENYDQAIERLRDCPHLLFGGTIELRQVDVM
jgi:hypothetical protein